MKTIVRILLLSILLQSFQCDENESNVSEITPEQLIEKKTRDSRLYKREYFRIEIHYCKEIYSKR